MTEIRWQKLRPGDVIENDRTGLRFVIGDVVYQEFRGKPKVIDVIATRTVRVNDHKQWHIIPKGRR